MRLLPNLFIFSSLILITLSLRMITLYNFLIPSSLLLIYLPSRMIFLSIFFITLFLIAMFLQITITNIPSISSSFLLISLPLSENLMKETINQRKNVRELMNIHLAGKLRLRLAGDIHHYTRHVPSSAKRKVRLLLVFSI